MKVKLTVILVLLSATLLFGRTSMNYTEQANAFFVKGCYVEAEEILDIAIAESPDKVENYLLQYKVMFAQSKMDQAHEALCFYVKNNQGADKEYYGTLLAHIEDGFIMGKKGKQFFKVGTLPQYINSKYSDFAPMLNHDGTKLYFTSSRREAMFKENVLLSQKVGGVWGIPQIVKALSTNNHESANSLSDNEDKIYLFGNFDNDRNKQGDIYQANRVRTAWTTPEKISEVSSKWSDQQPYVSNDEVMFFTSNREGSVGGYDIWVSEFDGRWNTPINLGSVINTNADEQTPFLDWDGETLYFSSNGHPSFGGFDIFKAKRKGLSWTDWEEPVNLGIDVNSVRDDRHFYRVANSNEVYFSSTRESTVGYEDLFKVFINTEDEAGDLNVAGYVKDVAGNPVATEITWSFKVDGSDIIRVINSDDDGFYKISLPEIDTLNYVVDDKDYLKVTNYIVFDGATDKLYHDIIIESLKEQSYVIENIFFDFDKATLREASYPSLDDVASKFLANTNIEACVIGYTDDKGTEKYNKNLSENRAKAVYSYLIEKGVEVDRLSFRGEGEHNPKADNDTEENRQLNRRVEFDLHFIDTVKANEVETIEEAKIETPEVEETVEVEVIVTETPKAEEKVVETTTVTEIVEVEDVKVEAPVEVEVVIEDVVETAIETTVPFFTPSEERVISNKVKRIVKEYSLTGNLEIELAKTNNMIKTNGILNDGNLIDAEAAMEIKNAIDGWRLSDDTADEYVLKIALD